MTPADFRRIALSLDGVEEVEHAGLPAFRAGGARFASLASQAAGYGNLTLTLEQQAEYDNLRSMVFLQIQGALIKVKTTSRNLALYRDTLKPQAEGTLKATSTAYKNDRTDFLNVLDSQNTTLDVESSYFKNAAELESRLADLERAVGAPISRDSTSQDFTPKVQQ